MIDKVFPRKLNSSKDTRLHAQDEMLDAVNVTFDDNGVEFQAGVTTATGNFGVLKPIKGNVAVNNGDGHSLANGSKVIGSCNDDRAGRIYYFVYSPVANQSGVYFYETSSNSLKKLLTSNLFNFRGNSFVDGNVVYIANSDRAAGATDLKPILFFTDNNTEPKKIDIQRVSEAGSGVNFLDFVSACPRTPLDPPVWSFQSDPSYKVSNFKGERGFQFAYQNIYKSGDVSALSTYSTLAVPSAYLNQGSISNPNFFAENYIAVIIPNEAFTSEVARVRVLARSGNFGSWLVIDEQDYAGGQVQVNFYNDEIYTVLPDAEAKKQFDALPKKARTQDVTNNRLFYANYVEGFDVPEVSASITHTFLERPQDFISVNLLLTPEIRQVNSNFSEESVNRVSGYRLDSAELPSTVSAGTQVIFNISLSPEGNFHFYESRDSFHSSAELKRFVSEGEEFHVTTNDAHQGKFASMGAGETVGIAPSGLGYFNGQDPDGFDVPTVSGGTQNLKREGITTSPYGLFLADGTAFPRWSANRPQDPQDFRAVYGTSAQNPFILQGSSCQFSGTFVTNVDLNKTRLVNIIKDMLVNNHTSTDSSLFNITEVGGETVYESVVQIVSLQNRHTYNIDLNLNNKDKINVYQSSDYRSKLVVAVGDHAALTGTDTRQVPPCGYFIVNKATPTVGLRDITPFYALSDYGQASDSFLALDLIDIQSFETMTCIPDVSMDANLGSKLLEFGDGQQATIYPLPITTQINDFFEWGNIFDGWVCFTPQFIKSPFGISAMTLTELGGNPNVDGLFKHNGREIYDIVSDGVFEFDTNPSTYGLPHLLTPDLQLGDLPFIDEINLYLGAGEFSDNLPSEVINTLSARNIPQISRWVGCLIPAGGFSQVVTGVGVTSVFNIVGGRLIQTFENYADDVLLNDGVDIKNDPQAYFQYAFTTLDGEGGAGGADTVFVNTNGINKSSLTHSMITMGFGSWLQNTDVTGHATILFDEFNHNLSLMRTGNISDMGAWYDAVEVDPDTEEVLVDEPISPNNPIFSEQRSIVEVTSFDAAIVPPVEGTGTNRSFKTKATHDFGIVFYDQRGRSTDVTPIGSVYVDGYDSASQQGPVAIQVNLTSEPPSWAWHYQIVYGGNNTYADFIQYTTGGAFLEFESETDTGNIYVSLNYLQNNSDVSYAQSFGAVNEDGSKDLYTYQEGDKLRIISYYTNNETRIFPTAYEFDIVGTKLFSEDESNILADPDFPPAIPSKVGQFLVLKDNPQAVGFSYSYVKAGQVDGNSPSSSSAHLWNNRCVVEIYRPLDVQGVEDRVYYEISKKYNIIRDASLAPTWENNNIVLNNGDVWFRRVAVNMPIFDSTVGKFRNIIKDAGNATPRFRDYHLETSTFTDTISGANQYDYGKPKIANRFQKEIRRDSSITFSDLTNLASPVLKYTSFDGTVGNFKDLPNKHGQISKIVDYGDALFVLNEDKISAIPIARSVISDVAGQDLVVASERVMGTQKFYAGDSGCSTNPESVVKVGESLYFANKESQEVYKFNPANGVTVISDIGMKSYFRELFQTVIDSAITSGQVRVVGGYDPILDEYILSVYNALTLVFDGDVEVLQPSGTADPDPPIDVDGPPVDFDEGIISDLQGQVEGLEEEISSLQEEVQYLNDQIDNLDIQAEGYEIIAEALTNQISSLNSTISDLQGQVQVLEEEIVSLEEYAQQLETELEIQDFQTESAIEVLTNEIDALEAVNTALAQLNTQLAQTIGQLNQEKNELLGDIAGIVGAIYNASAPIPSFGQEETPIVTFEQLFGSGYTGISPNVIEQLYQSIESNTLEATISELGVDLQGVILENLNSGIQSYASAQFDEATSVIGSQNDVILSLGLVRDALLIQAFYSISATWHLAGKPELSGVLPAPIEDLLQGLQGDDNSLYTLPTLADLYIAFDSNRDGVIDTSDIIEAANIVSTFEPILEALYSSDGTDATEEEVRLFRELIDAGNLRDYTGEDLYLTAVKDLEDAFIAAKSTR